MTQQIIKLSEVKLISGLSGSSIYRGAASGTFPKPIKLGERSSGWIKSEVDQWLNERIELSRNGEVA
ncbi:MULTISPECIES: helix-turn-helix transcriptional regulator [unclassified Methylophaga]|jgi:prophage regulatory protein|uniref:helix-turn-helix transcriptional regulator n=1 Tax=unclassified Methylophaga TaxID=2629249 RepID=UPI00259CCE9A|nr:MULTISPECIES: AlpA family transcriptional regulator [unclassified Methylophaga]|tara:strand:- start:2837 stop:3037 length:201 start_codon:yes stop_codon:yes gene_type:complete